MTKKGGTKLYEYQQRYNGKSGYCGKCQKAVMSLTVDHIIPVAILDMIDITGQAKYEWEENFEALCYPCNRFKGGRLDLANPKTVPLLKELVNNL